MTLSTTLFLLTSCEFNSIWAINCASGLSPTFPTVSKLLLSTVQPHRISTLAMVSHKAQFLAPSNFQYTLINLPAATTFPLQTALFADDTTIFTSSKITGSISSRLNAIMSCVNQWLIDNGLSLNVAKSKCMLIHPRKKRPSALNVAFNGSIIEQVETLSFWWSLLITIYTGDRTWIA